MKYNQLNKRRFEKSTKVLCTHIVFLRIRTEYESLVRVKRSNHRDDRQQEDRFNKFLSMKMNHSPHLQQSNLHISIKRNTLENQVCKKPKYSYLQSIMLKRKKLSLSINDK